MNGYYKVCELMAKSVCVCVCMRVCKLMDILWVNGYKDLTAEMCVNCD